MAQMSLFETGWKSTIYEVINTISVYEGLPAGSLMLVENFSRVKKTVSSYSVAILKPDYPKGMNPNGRAKNVLINIKDVTKKSDSNAVLSVSVPDSVLVRIRNEFPSVSFVKKEKDPITRALIPVDSKDIKVFFDSLISSVVEAYFKESSNSFGCCHLYAECSDAKKCLHENRLYARSCIYSTHLAEGHIFYGKNRNV